MVCCVLGGHFTANLAGKTASNVPRNLTVMYCIFHFIEKSLNASDICREFEVTTRLSFAIHSVFTNKTALICCFEGLGIFLIKYCTLFFLTSIQHIMQCNKQAFLNACDKPEY